MHGGQQWQKTIRQDKVWWGLSRYGPLYLSVAAIPLVLADQVRHLLQDANIWPSPSSDMYRDDCDVHHLDGIFCLSLVGWLFTIVFTYSGFACLVGGVVWAANLHFKLHKAWQDIRSAAASRSASRAVSRVASTATLPT
eukprot:jgi/Botrbrau1/16863/Bobra.150_2s0082.1